MYIGAPNVLEYVPGPRSIVHIRDFAMPEQLWAYLESFADDDSAEVAARYSEFFAWKTHAMSVYMQDEGGGGSTKSSVGTGHGVALRLPGPEDVVQALLPWAAAPDSSEAVPSLAEVKARLPLNDQSYADVAENAWRTFRHHLDHCVHYAECRLCELVSVLT